MPTPAASYGNPFILCGEVFMTTRKTKSLGFPSFCLGDLSYVDVQEYLKHSDTILIPKASLEQHGPHLPLSCDTITATEVAKRAGEEAGIMYTPTLWLGYSPQHMRAPGFGAGTITLRSDTLLNVLYDMGRSLIHHGFNRLIFVNGHGSNVKVVDPVLRRLRYETGALIGYYKPYAERYIGMLKDVLEGPVEETPGWHAGELETSQVLAHNLTSCVWIGQKLIKRIRLSGLAPLGRKKTVCRMPNSRVINISTFHLTMKNSPSRV
jgi:creatinine amidohydrolase/Fe(II)-dependent formamide hydrolase-like protein